MSDRPTEQPPVPESPPAPEATDAPEPTPPDDSAAPAPADAPAEPADQPTAPEPAEPGTPENDSAATPTPEAPEPPADTTPDPDEAPTPYDAAPEPPSTPEEPAEHPDTTHQADLPDPDEAPEPPEPLEPEEDGDSAPPPTPDADEAPDPAPASDAAPQAPEPAADTHDAPAADDPDEAPDPTRPHDAPYTPAEAPADTTPAPDEAPTPYDAAPDPVPAPEEPQEHPDATGPLEPSLSEEEPPDAAASSDDAPEPQAADARNRADAHAEKEAEPYDNSALRDGPSYQQEIDDQLGARGLDRSEHDKFRLTRTNELTEAQAREVVEVRDTIKLDEGRIVTKVITRETLDAYLDNATTRGEEDFNPGEFSGSIARGCDTADLRSMGQLRDGLALDDGGAGWTPVPPGASEAYQLRFPAPDDMRADPSLGAVGDQVLANHVAGMADQSRGRAWRDPFLGTGYTGGGVPEWIAEPTGFPHHAEIWCMHADGTEEAVGFFDKNERLWKII
ncbi:hypothetical protein OOK31_36705 [Streptomyces sp. NBC_00249]|uniref:hypothetical protein n=1 Tax=Streptomyces sp. NBC_00249 TaxID=2975690 RepID=UPI00225A3665|nr:hypothetical protein [Streptomyces sp. NBC_00249]MCX5199354.1 hypothetical protein [Streptomyces sp. NBC_00249]